MQKFIGMSCQRKIACQPNEMATLFKFTVNSSKNICIDKNISYILFSLVIYFLCAVSHAEIITSGPFPDLPKGKGANFKNVEEYSAFSVDQPLLESPPHQAGPELSPQNTMGMSSSQIFELAQLKTLASQAEMASNTSKKTSAISANSAWILGLLYLHGIGMPTDAMRAKYWFQVAWQQGEQMASAGLAWCEMVGCGMPSDLARARYWRTKLASVNRPRSLYFEWLEKTMLAPLEIPRGADPKTNRYNIANRELLLEAANAGDIHAHIELGIESASKNQLDDALKHFTFAAKKSQIAASNADHIRSNILNSSSLNGLQLSKSEQGESGELSLVQARRYHKGDGVPANYSEAIRLYKKASDLGNLEAKRMLGLIFSQPGDNGTINILWMQKLGQVDLSGSTPQLSNAYAPVLLHREETGLTDFIPQIWNRPGSTKKIEPMPCRPEVAPC
jgi:TPR repeat protein